MAFHWIRGRVALGFSQCLGRFLNFVPRRHKSAPQIQWHDSVDFRVKRMGVKRGNGHCAFCGRQLMLGVATSGVRIFRCDSCGMFGQAMTPPKEFRPTQEELKRERNRWRVAS